MAVTALVLTLTDDETERNAALSELTRHPGVTVGDPFGARFPVVVDTESTREDKRCFEQIKAMEGVHLIELVSVDYDETSGDETSGDETTGDDETTGPVPHSIPRDAGNESESSDGAGSPS